MRISKSSSSKNERPKKSFKAVVRNSLSKSLDKMKLTRKGQKKLIPAEINMLSGCHDDQIAHGISNTSRFFNFPHANGDNAPGGAFTSAFLEIAYKYDYEYKNNPELRKNWVDLLIDVREKFEARTSHLKNMKEQIPQITSSRKIKEDQRCRMINRSTGKKYAVLIGINYTNVQDETMQLRGSHNDVANVKKYLMDVHGFEDRNITTLMDDVDILHPNPTKDNIMGALDEVAQDSKAGDSIFVLYSGHGGQIKDLNGDEADGYDEVLVPVDYYRDGVGEIVDDDLYTDFVEKVPKDVLVTCLFDCCHSGTVLDLPYVLELEEAEEEPQEGSEEEMKDEDPSEKAPVRSLRGLERQSNVRSLRAT